jgi:hypothetical protein
VSSSVSVREKANNSNAHPLKKTSLTSSHYWVLKYSAFRYGQHNCLQNANYNLLGNVDVLLNGGIFFLHLEA